MRELYPPIEPYEHGWLDVGDGHRLYYERVGTSGAKPAVFLHGGPGGGIAPDDRRFFDPAAYDVLIFDQRGCGRSTPFASLAANTTWHLVADLERLRAFVGADQWLLFGGSWGSTLALAYAQAHPQRISGLILRGIFTARQTEVDWFYRYGASELFPENWSAFIAPVPVHERSDLIRAYARLLASDDDQVRLRAIEAWASWEGSTVRLVPDSATEARFRNPRVAEALARIETHYFLHRCWLEDDQLIAGADRLCGIQGTIVQGRYDVVCPPRTANELYRRWPEARLEVVEEAGHSAREPRMVDRLVRATDRYRD